MTSRMLWLLEVAVLSALPSSVGAKAVTYRATVAQPGFDTIQRLARSKHLPGLRAHSKGVAIGGTRFVSVVSSQHTQRLELVVVEHGAAGWKLAQRLLLPPAPPLAPRAEGCPPDDRKLSAVVFAADYDGDGKPEAYVRRLDCQNVPAIGAVRVRRLYLVNLDGRPRLALHTSYGYDALPTAMGAQRARARFVDVDRDGHDDLVVSVDEEYPGVGSAVRKARSQRVYLWRAKTDGYVEQRQR